MNRAIENTGPRGMHQKPLSRCGVAKTGWGIWVVVCSGCDGSGVRARAGEF